VYLPLTVNEMKQYEADMSKLNKPQQEAVMEITTSWEKQGLEQGRQQGRQEGIFSVVSRLLNRRLAPLPSSILKRVHNLPTEHLEALSEALLDFTGADGLEQWL